MLDRAIAATEERLAGSHGAPVMSQQAASSASRPNSRPARCRQTSVRSSHADGTAAQYRRLRAPQGDGQTLVDPPWPTLADVVARNRQHLAELEYDVQGRSLADLAASARRVAGRAGRRVHAPISRRARRGIVEAASPTGRSSSPATSRSCFTPACGTRTSCWATWPRKSAASAIHLLIDSDLCRSASIRVPTGTVDRPRVEAVPFDQPAAEVPYEERTIRDEATLRAVLPTA